MRAGVVGSVVPGGAPADGHRAPGSCQSPTWSESLTTIVPAARSPSRLPLPFANSTISPTPYAYGRKSTIRTMLRMPACVKVSGSPRSPTARRRNAFLPIVCPDHSASLTQK